MERNLQSFLSFHVIFVFLKEQILKSSLSSGVTLVTILVLVFPHMASYNRI